MGTNIYFTMGEDLTEDDIKPGTGLHVGKSSAGWSFGFRAYRYYTMDPTSPKLKIGKVLFAIESRTDWASFFGQVPGLLMSENGVLIEDPLEWVLNLEAPDRKQIGKEISPEMRGPTPFPICYDSGVLQGMPKEWRDQEGFRFYDGVFC